jgi:hypothetical protein
MVAALIVYMLVNCPRLGPAQQSSGGRSLAVDGVRASVVLLLACGIPYAIYFLCRWGYFGRLLPNPVYCKSLWGGDAFTLLKGFWAEWKLLILLSLVAPWSAIGVTRIFMWLLTAVYLLILIGVDPIIGHWNRHLLVVFPPLLLSATWSIHWVLQVGLRERWRRTASLVIVSATLLAVLLDHPSAVKQLETDAGRYARRMDTRTRLGQWIDERLGPTQWYLIGDAGMVPYRTRAKVLDPFCLNNKEATTTLKGASPDRIADTLVSKNPDLVVVHSKRPDRLQPRSEYGFYPALLKLPQFSANYALRVRFATAFDDFHYFVFEKTARPARP